MSQEKLQALVLPRPNRGPEPWSDEGSNSWLPPALGLLGLFLLAAMIGILRWRRPKRTASPPAQPVLAMDTPDAQLLRLAGQARETLVTRFGPLLRARTTEEISKDAAVKEALGEDHFTSLIRLLSAADHWKFASRPENGQTSSWQEELPLWSDWQNKLPVPTPGKRRPNFRGSQRRL